MPSIPADIQRPPCASTNKAAGEIALLNLAQSLQISIQHDQLFRVAISYPQLARRGHHDGVSRGKRSRWMSQAHAGDEAPVLVEFHDPRIRTLHDRWVRGDGVAVRPCGIGVGRAERAVLGRRRAAMPLDDIEVVVLVEGDIQRLIEHPVPGGVIPRAVFAALAEHHQDFAFRVQLPEHIPIRVGRPDVAVSIDPQRVRIDRRCSG